MDEDLKMAVGIKYQKDKDKAPRVIASGKGYVAQLIVDEAEQHGVPLYKDPNLVELLVKLPLESEIPPELYYTVAEVLAFVYQINQKASK